jgi:hypothetical protein
MLPVLGLVLLHSLTSSALMLSFMQRRKPSGLCPVDVQTITESGQVADNKLFRTVYCLIAIMYFIAFCMEKSNVFYHHNLRPRLHNRTLPGSTDKPINCNFINRVLFSGIYWVFSILPVRFVAGLISEYSIRIYRVAWLGGLARMHRIFKRRFGIIGSHWFSCILKERAIKAQI